MTGEKELDKCKTCKYSGRTWDDLPCDACTMGGRDNFYVPSDSVSLSDVLEIIDRYANGKKEKIDDYKEREAYYFAAEENTKLNAVLKIRNAILTLKDGVRIRYIGGYSTRLDIDYNEFMQFVKDRVEGA